MNMLAPSSHLLRRRWRWRAAIRRDAARPVPSASAVRGALLVVFAGWLIGGGGAVAGTVTGRLEFPPQEKYESTARRGYLDPVDNAILPVQPFQPAPLMVVALEAEASSAAAPPPQAVYELRGESFARPLIAVVKGQEVVIRNVGLAPRALVVQEDKDLLPAGTLNVTGSKSFRVAAAGKLYTIVDPTVPHLVGRILTLDTPYHANPERDGRFTIEDVPPGTYKLRVFFQDRWLSRETKVTVAAGPRGKAEVRVAIPADYRTAK
jgi:Polysaccharide lyase family 4, domain II